MASWFHGKLDIAVEWRANDMPSYEHKKLIERIAPLVTLPTNNEQYRAWTTTQPHLALLLENAEEDELIIYASGPHAFVHAVVIDENSLTPLDHDDLLNWNSDPYSSLASYVWGRRKRRCLY